MRYLKVYGKIKLGIGPHFLRNVEIKFSIDCNSAGGNTIGKFYVYKNTNKFVH